MSYLGSFGKSFQSLPSGALIHPFVSFIRQFAHMADPFTLSHRDCQVAVLAPAAAGHDSEGSAVVFDEAW
jgi:hypothetical protein